jgi:adenylyltransferase/sulfurtransferase
MSNGAGEHDRGESGPMLHRYARQTRLPEIGEAGQAKLNAARVAIVGCGALGCAAADLLCRAGVGQITLIDRDVVEVTNLQRQVLFCEADARDGVPKVEAARRRLNAVNSSVDVRAVVADVHHRNVTDLLAMEDVQRRPQVILDGTDNFTTRYLLNDLAVKYEVQFLYAGVVGTHAMQMNVLPGLGACLRCVFAEPPVPGSQPTCESAGVLGAAVMMVAALQATEAMKLIVGASDEVRRTLCELDVWTSRWREIEVERDAQCVTCGARRFEFLESMERPQNATLCGQNAVQIGAPQGAVTELAALAERLGGSGRVTRTAFMVRVELSQSPLRMTVFADGRAIVHGTSDAGVARAVYDRLIGS